MPLPRSETRVTLVDASGLTPNVDLAQVELKLAAKAFIWLDVCGADAVLVRAYLKAFDARESEIAWALNFEQAGRMIIERNGVLRAVTWLAGSGLRLVEVHLRSSPHGIVTIWNGDPEALDGVRRNFVERIGGFRDHPYHAAGVLLELLLSTVDQGVSGLNERVQQHYQQVENRPDSVEFADLSRALERVRAIWLKFDRFASAARSATVGIEAIPDMGEQGARELNEYVEHIENVEQRLQERHQWTSGLMQDYATALARRQGEQIRRLTVVSIIFLPITFLTGFFGMNFTYLASMINGPVAFVGLGVVAPLACAAATMVWLRSRRLL